MIFGITCLVLLRILLLVLPIEIKFGKLTYFLSCFAGMGISTGTIILCKYNTWLKNKNKDNEKIEDESIDSHDWYKGEFFWRED